MEFLLAATVDVQLLARSITIAKVVLLDKAVVDTCVAAA
jgi:hypothetical protein